MARCICSPFATSKQRKCGSTPAGRPSARYVGADGELIKAWPVVTAVPPKMRATLPGSALVPGGIQPETRQALKTSAALLNAQAP